MHAVEYSTCMYFTHTHINAFTAVTTTAAIFMRGICTELHYHGPASAFVLPFVGFSARLCLCQMSRLCGLCILSINVNNYTYNIMEARRPSCTRHINTFLCVWFCAFFLPFFTISLNMNLNRPCRFFQSQFLSLYLAIFHLCFWSYAVWMPDLLKICLKVLHDSCENLFFGIWQNPLTAGWLFDIF